jgi:hypothetical protein
VGASTALPSADHVNPRPSHIYRQRSAIHDSGMLRSCYRLHNTCSHASQSRPNAWASSILTRRLVPKQGHYLHLRFVTRHQDPPRKKPTLTSQNLAIFDLYQQQFANPESTRSVLLLLLHPACCGVDALSTAAQIVVLVLTIRRTFREQSS